MTIKQFNPTTCQILRNRLKEAVAELEKELGVEIKIGRMKYSETSVTIATEAVLGGGLDREAQDLRSMLPLMGLFDEDLNNSFSLQGEIFKLVGYRSRARKNCMVIKSQSSGKTYVTTRENVVTKLKEVRAK